MILALDTSSNSGEIAVVTETGEALFHRCFRTERSHNSTLFPLLEEMFERVGDRSLLSYIAVGTGPGSYTGCRIGIAAAQGLGLALGIPVTGVPSITAIAGAPAHIALCGDARRGSYFYAEVENGVMTSAPVLGDREFLIESLAGSGLPAFSLDSRPPLVDPNNITLSKVDAVTLATRIDRSLPPEPPAPIYLAAPFVTTPKTRPAHH